MRDSPDTGDLLTAARASVLHELLPALPDALHYEALMVANALAIARRMLSDAECGLQAELAALRHLYALPPVPNESSACVYTALRRRLANDIRRGTFDTPDPRHDIVQNLLWDAVVRRMRVVSPKLLDAAGAPHPPDARPTPGTLKLACSSTSAQRY